MRRGDLVIVATPGDFGKPRPAVIVQTDALPLEHASVVVCPVTSHIGHPSDFRVTVDPTRANGLRVRSEVMIDKPVSVWRERIGQRIGHLESADMARINTALAFVFGLTD